MDQSNSADGRTDMWARVYAVAAHGWKSQANAPDHRVARLAPMYSAEMRRRIAVPGRNVSWRVQPAPRLSWAAALPMCSASAQDQLPGGSNPVLSATPVVRRQSAPFAASGFPSSSDP